MDPQKICPTCGTLSQPSERFCPRDGSALRTYTGGPTDLVGQVIAGHFHVVRKLGEGGMGQVYLAEHMKIGRMCALKVMNPEIANNPDSISRFNREAANASRINHPNVAAVYDFGESADGLIFLAMEFVDGPPLTKLIDGHGTLPPGRVAEIVRQVADGLAVAHDIGIVHRDLKPDNILVARNRVGTDLVKVVDFGIAKARDGGGQSVTTSGLIVGTPEYMSPEQCEGRPLDGRSDTYSLGLVAYKMLTGALPFASRSVQEALAMRLVQPPKPLAEVRPDVHWPADLQAVLDKALHRDVESRYRSAPEFAGELERAVRSMTPSISGGGVVSTESVTRIEPIVTAAPQIVPAPRSEPAGPGPLPASAAPRTRVRRWVMGVGMVALGSVLVITVVQLRTTTGANQPLAPAPTPSPSKGQSAESPAKTPQQSAAPKERAGSSVGASNAGLQREPVVTFAAPSITIQVSGLPPALARTVADNVRGMDGVALTANATEPADLLFGSDASGAVTIKRQNGTPVGTTIAAASVATAIVLVLRRELAISTLAALDNVPSTSSVRFQVADGKLVFALKDRIRLRVQPTMAGYLTVVDVDPAGVVTVLHPSAETDVGRIASGQEIKFEDEFVASLPAGDGRIRAIISERPLALKKGNPVLLSIDGPSLARDILRELEKQVHTGTGGWATASFAYTIRQ